MSDAPPIINASDLKRNAGQIVRVAGEYRPEFNPRHRTLVEDANGNLTAAGCIVLLALADGRKTKEKKVKKKKEQERRKKKK